MPDTKQRDWSKITSIGISVGTSLLVLAFFFGGMMENAETKQARIDKSLVPLEDKIELLMDERKNTQLLSIQLARLEEQLGSLNHTITKLETTVRKLQDK